MVEAGDHDRARHPDGRALLPQRHRGLVDAFGGTHHEQRGVRGPQAGAQLTDEIGISGCVDEVDLHVLVHQWGNREPDRPLLTHGRRVVVAHGRALGDRAGPPEYSGGGQQCFGQSGFAGAGWSDEDYVAHTAWVFYSDRNSVLDVGMGTAVRGLGAHRAHLPWEQVMCSISHPCRVVDNPKRRTPTRRSTRVRPAASKWPGEIVSDWPAPAVHIARTMSGGRPLTCGLAPVTAATNSSPMRE